MSKKQIAEMIRLGKEARRIERETRAKHEREEVPKAEEELLEALKDIETNKIKTAKK